MVDISIGITGAESFKRKLGILSDAISDMRPIFDEVVEPWFRDHMKEQFSTSGKHGGAPWAGYRGEPKYAAYKNAIVGHLKPLQWGAPFERLKPSLEKNSHAFGVYKRDKENMVIGTSVPYAGRLNKGGVGPFGERYPGRKVMAITAGQKKGLVTLIQRRIQRELRAKGGGLNRSRRNL